MTCLDLNDLLTKEILPEVNNIIAEYIDSEFSYIEDEDDLEDLEESEVDDALYNTVEEYLKDIPELKSNNKIISQKIQKIQQLTGLNSAAVEEVKNNDFIDQSSQEELADAWSQDIF